VARELLRWFGQGLLTRPYSATDGLPVPDRWRGTRRPVLDNFKGYFETLASPPGI